MRKLTVVARVLENKQLVGLVFFDYITKTLIQVAMQRVTPDMLAPNTNWLIPSLPVWGTPENKIVLLAKEKHNYYCYINGKVYVKPAPEFGGLIRKGYKLPNAVYVHTANKKPYLKLKRGTLFDYEAFSKAEKPFYFLAINATVDCDEITEEHIFRGEEKAREAFRKAVKEARETANLHDYVIESSKDSFVVYEEGAYCENHIAVTLDVVMCEDANIAR